MKIFLKAMNSILAKYYAFQTRQNFRKWYEEGRIDWMPEKITANIDEDGEVKIYITPMPPFIRATPNFTYDQKKDERTKRKGGS